MPGPGPYGNKRPAARANQERRKKLATKVARKTAKLEPNRSWSGDKQQFKDAYTGIMRYNPDSPEKYKRFGARLKAAKGNLRELQKKKRMDGAYKATGN